MLLSLQIDGSNIRLYCADLSSNKVSKQKLEIPIIWSYESFLI